MKYYLLSLLPVLSICRYAFAIGGAMQGLEDAMDIQRSQLERLREFMGPEQESHQLKAKRQSTITFSNPAAEQFFVDGTTIPEG